MFRFVTAAATVGLLTMVACADDAPMDDTTTFAEQASAGGALYGEHCAECHGDMGQGSSLAPRVVGLSEGALPLDPRPEQMVRMNQFVTVGDVATFASMNMPGDDPGSLQLEEYLSILAFALSANGIDLEEPLTLELAGTITIPR